MTLTLVKAKSNNRPPAVLCPFRREVALNKNMKLIRFFCMIALFDISLSMARADDFKLEPGYISLFNGTDLTGWGDLTNRFDGKAASDDGRYSATNGVLTVNPRVPRLVQK